MNRALLASSVAIFVMGACLLLYLYLGLPRQQPPADINVNITPELTERGGYLAKHVALCGDCHSKRDWNLFGGPTIPPWGAGQKCLNRSTKIVGVRVSDDNVPGVLCIRNLTPDDVSGLGNWTDGEIIRAVREGVGADGHGIYPIMPYSAFRRLSDDDVVSLVAYLRQLPPVRTRWLGRGIEFPMGLLTQFWPEPLTRPVRSIDPENSATYGSYLTIIGRCEYCHSTRRQYGRNLAPERRFAGGVEFEVGGKKVVSTNLTPHESGLKNVSREEFIAKFKSYSEPQEVPEEGNTPMNWTAYAGMTEEDLGAIYDFLRTRWPVDTSKD